MANRQTNWTTVNCVTARVSHRLARRLATVTTDVRIKSTNVLQQWACVTRVSFLTSFKFSSYYVIPTSCFTWKPAQARQWASRV